MKTLSDRIKVEAKLAAGDYNYPLADRLKAIAVEVSKLEALVAMHENPPVVLVGCGMSDRAVTLAASGPLADSCYRHGIRCEQTLYVPPTEAGRPE